MCHEQRVIQPERKGHFLKIYHQLPLNTNITINLPLYDDDAKTSNSEELVTTVCTALHPVLDNLREIYRLHLHGLRPRKSSLKDDKLSLELVDLSDFTEVVYVLIPVPNLQEPGLR